MQNQKNEDPSICSLSHSQGSDSQEKLFYFLNSELRPKKKILIQQEYPALYGDFPGGQSLYIERDGQIVSHVGFIIREFQHPYFRMKVGLIGSVITALPFRGHGMASQLLRQTFQQLKLRGCAVAVLWSELSDFYLPLGFHRGGREVDFKFSAKRITEPVDISSARPIDFERDAASIWRLYQRHELKIDRSLEEQKKLCCIPQTQIYVTEKEGVLTSYLAINKGADFDGYIHEWGGDLTELSRNILFCQKQIFPNKDLTLIAPHDYDLNPIKKISVEHWDGVLGLLKILDRNNLLSAYGDYLKKNGTVFSWDPNKETVFLDSKQRVIKTDKECLALLFGTQGDNEFPSLPFFLWGFDSV